MFDIKFSLRSIYALMINLQMSSLGSTELHGYRKCTQGSSREKYLAPVHKGLQAKRTTLMSLATEEVISDSKPYSSNRIGFLFLKMSFKYFQHAKEYRK
jgi:hypothetical protein